MQVSLVVALLVSLNFDFTAVIPQLTRIEDSALYDWLPEWFRRGDGYVPGVPEDVKKQVREKMSEGLLYQLQDA